MARSELSATYIVYVRVWCDIYTVAKSAIFHGYTVCEYVVLELLWRGAKESTVGAGVATLDQRSTLHWLWFGLWGGNAVHSAVEIHLLLDLLLPLLPGDAKRSANCSIAAKWEEGSGRTHPQMLSKGAEPFPLYMILCSAA